ncbi:hypothetical protein TIFTF001_017754 [Ficus carica]|uniref:Zinc finger PMZ-type domain-containing protein n=1 Tax=Ficus carica TaxID=3494 RepID=A0AA88AR86_FICCA|nr:hypothetical protein TIFTF001_017754 [Ficus carica]
MCLASSKQGWHHYCPVIVVNRSALMARFKGMLLAAYGQDVDGSIIPLAFACNVYPVADFEICVQHLAANLKMRYKDFKGPMKTYFDGASRVYFVSEHQRHMESIRNRNPNMYRYFLQVNPKKWSQAYFNGRRYVIMTTNIDESLRLMLVGFLVEWLRELLQRLFVEKHEEALKLTSILALKAEKLLRTLFSLGLIVTHWPADQFKHVITNKAAQTWIVEIREITCTCRHFQVYQIPCPNDMVICNHRRIDSYNYCSHYYTIEALFAAYEPIVHPISSTEGWGVSKKVRSQVVNPPMTKRGPKKPSVTRILSQGEEPETIRCSRSHDYGHNRQTCTNTMSLRTSPTTRPQRSSTSQSTVM